MKILNSILILAAILFAVLPLNAQEDEEAIPITVADLSWLEGTWKVEGARTYEEWVAGEIGVMEGVGYKMENEVKLITETLVISETTGELTYYATVANQNDGRTIPFVCAGYHNEDIVFVNRDHDFPNKIQYTLIDPDRILIRLFKVEEGYFVQSMAYYMVRQ